MLHVVYVRRCSVRLSSFVYVTWILFCWIALIVCSELGTPPLRQDLKKSNWYSQQQELRRVQQIGPYRIIISAWKSSMNNFSNVMNCCQYPRFLRLLRQRKFPSAQRSYKHENWLPSTMEDDLKFLTIWAKVLDEDATLCGTSSLQLNTVNHTPRASSQRS